VKEDGSDFGWAGARPNSAIDQSGEEGDDRNEGQSESNRPESHTTHVEFSYIRQNGGAPEVRPQVVRSQNLC
jgi:hypothetical protein